MRLVLNSFLTRTLIELLFVARTFITAEPKNKPFRTDDSNRKKLASLHNCYSCMNLEFYEYWSQIEHTYNRPVNFTDVCLSLPAKSNIGFVLCDTACIIIKEQRLAGGSAQGFNVVRGCLATVTRYQLAPDVVGLSRRSSSSKNICHSIEAKNLYPEFNNVNPPARDSNSVPRFLVTICTCYGHLCNGEAIAASDKRFNLFCFVPFFIIWSSMYSLVSL